MITTGGVLLNPPNPLKAPKTPPNQKSARCICINKCFKTADDAYKNTQAIDRLLWAAAVKMPKTGAYDLWMTEALPFIFAGYPPPDVPSLSGNYNAKGAYPGCYIRPPTCAKPTPIHSLRGSFKTALIIDDDGNQRLQLTTALLTNLTRSPIPITGRIRAIWSTDYHTWLVDVPFTTTNKATWLSPTFWYPSPHPFRDVVYIQFDTPLHTFTWETRLRVTETYPVTWPQLPSNIAHRDSKPFLLKSTRQQIGHRPRNWHMSIAFTKTFGRTRTITERYWKTSTLATHRRHDPVPAWALRVITLAPEYNFMTIAKATDNHTNSALHGQVLSRFDTELLIPYPPSARRPGALHWIYPVNTFITDATTPIIFRAPVFLDEGDRWWHAGIMFSVAGDITICRPTPPSNPIWGIERDHPIRIDALPTPT